MVDVTHRAAIIAAGAVLGPIVEVAGTSWPRRRAPHFEVLTF